MNPNESRSVLLEARNLCASHGQLMAVREVSLQLKAGETVALVGSNGAGKTTLMRTLAGVHPASGGSVLLAGAEVTALPAHRRVQQGLALVPEGRRLFADMTVRENLLLAREHRGRLREGDAGWTIERVVQALPALAPLMNRPAGALSGGQRQAAAIARALMTNPAVLLIDEVSLGLSPRAVDEVYTHLAELRREAGTTLLLVEQDLARAMAFADRVLCLREGRIVLAASSAEGWTARPSPTLISAWSTPHDRRPHSRHPAGGLLRRAGGRTLADVRRHAHHQPGAWRPGHAGRVRRAVAGRPGLVALAGGARDRARDGRGGHAAAAVGAGAHAALGCAAAAAGDHGAGRADPERSVRRVRFRGALAGRRAGRAVLGQLDAAGRHRGRPAAGADPGAGRGGAGRAAGPAGLDAPGPLHPRCGVRPGGRRPVRGGRGRRAPGRRRHLGRAGGAGRRHAGHPRHHRTLCRARCC